MTGLTNRVVLVGFILAIASVVSGYRWDCLTSYSDSACTVPVAIHAMYFEESCSKRTASGIGCTAISGTNNYYSFYTACDTDYDVASELNALTIHRFAAADCVFGTNSERYHLASSDFQDTIQISDKTGAWMAATIATNCSSGLLSVDFCLDGSCSTDSLTEQCVTDINTSAYQAGCTAPPVTPIAAPVDSPVAAPSSGPNTPTAAPGTVPAAAPVKTPSAAPSKMSNSVALSASILTAVAGAVHLLF